MEIFRGIAELGRRFTRPVLTIGNFDGVHRGHQAILSQVIDRAAALEGESVLYTFEPHPRRVLQPGAGLRLLETFDQRMESLERLGLDAVIAEPFDRPPRCTSATTSTSVVTGKARCGCLRNAAPISGSPLR